MKTKIMMMTLGALFLSACAGSKTPHGSSDNASLEVPGDSVVGTKVYSYCNDTASRSSTFRLALHSYVQEGNLRNDLMYGMLTELPSDFKTTSRPLRFFRWKIDSNGQKAIDPTPLTFKLVNPANGQILLSGQDYIRWNDVASFASDMHITDPKEFFRRAFFIIDLKDSLAQYEGLLTISYNPSSQSDEDDRAESLLPLFDVDPNGYATTPQGGARSAVLQALHPYKSSMGLSLSVTQNKSRVQALCAPWSEGL